MLCDHMTRSKTLAMLGNWLLAVSDRMCGSLRVEVTWPIHAGELAAPQEDHPWLQSAAPRNPTADRCRIHFVQHPRGFRIRHRPATGATIPCGMKSECCPWSYANSIAGNSAENDSAGRCTQAIDLHGFAGTAKTLKPVNVSSDTAAPIVGNSHYGMTCANT